MQHEKRQQTESKPSRPPPPPTSSHRSKKNHNLQPGLQRPRGVAPHLSSIYSEVWGSLPTVLPYIQYLPTYLYYTTLHDVWLHSKTINKIDTGTGGRQVGETFYNFGTSFPPGLLYDKPPHTPVTYHRRRHRNLMQDNRQIENGTLMM